MASHTRDERDERVKPAKGLPFGDALRETRKLKTELPAPKAPFGPSTELRDVRVRLVLNTDMGEEQLREFLARMFKAEELGCRVTRVREATDDAPTETPEVAPKAAKNAKTKPVITIKHEGEEGGEAFGFILVDDERLKHRDLPKGLKAIGREGDDPSDDVWMDVTQAKALARKLGGTYGGTR